MDVLEAIHGRRSVRNYADKALSDSVIRSLIGEAVWAPSGVNLQPWCFFVVDDSGALAAYSAEAKALMLRQADVHPELTNMREMLASPQIASSVRRAPDIRHVAAGGHRDAKR